MFPRTPNSPNGGIFEPGGTIGTFPRNGGLLMNGGNWGIPKKGGPYGKAAAAAAAAAALPAAPTPICSPPEVGGVDIGDLVDIADETEPIGLDDRKRLASAEFGLADAVSRENSSFGSDRTDNR